MAHDTHVVSIFMINKGNALMFLQSVIRSCIVMIAKYDWLSNDICAAYIWIYYLKR